MLPHTLLRVSVAALRVMPCFFGSVLAPNCTWTADPVRADSPAPATRRCPTEGLPRSVFEIA
jgi:hypothetical protein